MSARRIYADHAATTPVRPEVTAAMLPYFDERGFNASSLHAEGRRARAALDAARERVAALLGCKPREIVFTGGGSEADNLAILGAARARGRPAHAITAAGEHHAVLHAFELLRDAGWHVTVLPLEGGGRVAPEALREALRPNTALISIMLANNELGTLQPVAELAALRARGVVFHTDAIQAVGRVPVSPQALDVDLLALSAHKFYGPKGVGALFVREGTPLAPLVVGGGQEAGLRAGTENVAGIVGFAIAFEFAVAELATESARLAGLRDRFEATLRARIPAIRVNAAGAPRLPSTSSLAFEGVDAQSLLARLDLDGVAVSSGSACAAGASEPSHVLAALEAPAWVQLGTIRFSFGRLTSEEDVTRLGEMLPKTIASMREPGRLVGTFGSGPRAGRSEGRPCPSA